MTYEYVDEARIDMGALVGSILRKLPRIILLTSIILVITYIILSLMTPQYRSSASILVEPRQSIFTRASDAPTNNNFGADSTTVSSQVELIKSRDLLMRVIEKENLRDVAEFNGSKTSLLGAILGLLRPAEEKKSPDERVLQAVAKNLKVTQLRGTRVISVSFTSEDPELAARVANSIANMHVQRRAELSVSDTLEATSWLAREVEEMRKRVAEAEAAVANYRINNDLFSGSNNTNILDQQLTVIATQISQAQERKNEAQSKVDLIRGLLKQGKSIETLPDIRASTTIQRLIQDKAKLQGERAQLLATLLPNHPNVQSISAQIAEINKQIRNEGNRVADALAAEAQIQARLEQSLKDELTRLKMEVSDATKDSVTLNELEREAKAQRDLLNTYLVRYRDASARTDVSSSLPDVRVVSLAAPAITPVSPQKKLILLAVAIIAVTFQIVQIISAEFISGRAIKYVKQPIVMPNMPTNPYYQAGFTPYGADYPSFAMGAEGSEAAKGTKGAEKSAKQMEEIAKEKERQKNQNIADNNYMAEVKTNLQNIAAQIANANQQIILVATISANANSLIKSLSANLLNKGKSVIEIDAGSRKITSNIGFADLCNGKVDFGDIIQRQNKSDYAIIEWGQEKKLNIYSPYCDTLIAALKEIFDLIIINVGEAGISPSIAAFADYKPIVLLSVDGKTSRLILEKVKADIRALGFNHIEVIITDENKARVA